MIHSLLCVALHVVAAFSAPSVNANGMAATAHPLATAAADEMLQAGGNAVDAAVAAAFVISVTNPFDTGLGGGGFAMVHIEKDGEVAALDFREVAPRAATKTMYLDDAGKLKDGVSMNGALAVAVPGTVPGLVELHKKYGRLPFRKLLRPAIAVARDGFVVGDKFVRSFAFRHDVLVQYAATRDAFMKRDVSGQQVPLVRGDVLRQPDLARTLANIAQSPDTIRSGSVALAIVAAVKAGGGIVTVDDLASYQPRWRQPLCQQWREHELCMMPPPSSGGVLVLEMLNIIGDSKLEALGWHHPDALHLMIESMRTAFADRAQHLGDPAFVQVPAAGLTSTQYGEARRAEIDMRHSRKSAAVVAAPSAELAKFGCSQAPGGACESHDTSHLSVVDRDRNAVSLTFTVNYGFGSGLVAAGTGVMLNDEMDDFAAAPGVANAYGLVGGEANAIAAGKVPLSSMTPLIVRHNKHFYMTAGAPGGSTIITTVLQTFLHVAVYGMDCQAAVSAPRLHHQWQPDSVRIEAFGLDDGTRRELEARGHTFNVTEPWGNAMCIRQTQDGMLEGGADPRGEGSARGPQLNAP